MGMDPDEIRTTFADRGVIRLDGAFGAESAARIEASVWSYVESKAGIGRNDRATWPTSSPSIGWKGLDREPMLDAIAGSSMVHHTLDAIFGAGGWKPPRRSARILFTMPSEGPWTTVNAGWHMDCGFERPTWPVFAVTLFAFVGEVGPRGGGTLLLPGSHRVVERYRAAFETPPAAGKQGWLSFIRANPPLDELLRGATKPERHSGPEVVGKRLDVDGIPVEVVELTGSPGDVVITHMHVFHSASANTSDAPRLMLRKAVDASGRQTEDGADLTMLTDEQRASYDEWGYCRVPKAFERASAEAMVASIWRELDPEIGTGLDALRQVREANERLRRAGVFRPVSSPAARGDRRPYGARLVDERTWLGRAAAHTAVQATHRVGRPLVWLAHGRAVLSRSGHAADVRLPQRRAPMWRRHPRGRRLASCRRSVATRHPDRRWRAADYRKSLRRSEPWFADLVAQQRSPRTRTPRFMDESGDMLGIRVRVIELTASAGDVVLWHPSLLHAPAPNTRANRD